MFYIYILQSRENKKLYRGLTADLKKRLREHNEGKARSTKNYLPWDLIYYEAFVSKKDARREELFLKSGKGRERLKYLFSDN